MRRSLLLLALLASACGGDTLRIEVDLADALQLFGGEPGAALIAMEYEGSVKMVALDLKSGDGFDEAEEALVVPDVSAGSETKFTAVMYQESLDELGVPNGPLETGGSRTIPPRFERILAEQTVSGGPGAWRKIEALSEKLSGFVSDDLPQDCDPLRVEVFPTEMVGIVQALVPLPDARAFALVGYAGNWGDFGFFDPHWQAYVIDPNGIERIDDRIPEFETTVGRGRILRAVAGPDGRVWVSTSTHSPNFSSNNNDVWVGDLRSAFKALPRRARGDPAAGEVGGEWVVSMALRPSKSPDAPAQLYVETPVGDVQVFDEATQTWSLVRLRTERRNSSRAGLVFQDESVLFALDPARPGTVLRLDLDPKTEVAQMIDFMLADPEIGAFAATPLGPVVLNSNSLGQVVTHLVHDDPGTPPTPLTGYEGTAVLRSQVMNVLTPWKRGFVLAGQFSTVAQFTPGYGYCDNPPGFQVHSLIQAVTIGDQVLVAGHDAQPYKRLPDEVVSRMAIISDH